METYTTKKSQKIESQLAEANITPSRQMISFQDNRALAVEQNNLKRMITFNSKVKQGMVIQKMKKHTPQIISSDQPIIQFDFSEELSKILKGQQEDELELLKKKGRVESIVKGIIDRDISKVECIKVGVTFRTDSRGSAHKDHDIKAILAMNSLLPFKVEAVSLPEGASGEDTPQRGARPEDLDNVDMLFIPGAPTANDTQTGDPVNVPQEPIPPGEAPEKPLAPGDTAPKKEKNRYTTLLQQYQGQKKKYDSALEKYNSDLAKYQRNQREHSSRSSYELSLIKFAQTRGIPIMALCAGSWRLLQAFGGSVETLPPKERAKHKATKPEKTWEIGHGINIMPRTMLSSVLFSHGSSTSSSPSTPSLDSSASSSSTPSLGSIANVNSTHWAVASEEGSTLAKHRDSDRDPSKELLISARASGKEVVSGEDLQRETVEAFETISGVPIMGLQWHPESYLPGMPGEHSGSEEAQKSASKIFRFMGGAALTSAIRRRSLVKEIKTRVPQIPSTHEGTGTRGITDMKDIAIMQGLQHSFSQPSMKTSITGPEEMDMPQIEKLVIFFKGKAKPIEDKIQEREKRGELHSSIASNLQHIFTHQVENLIRQVFEQLQMHPKDEDNIMNEGIIIMERISAELIKQLDKM